MVSVAPASAKVEPQWKFWELYSLKIHFSPKIGRGSELLIISEKTSTFPLFKKK